MYSEATPHSLPLMTVFSFQKQSRRGYERPGHCRPHIVGRTAYGRLGSLDTESEAETAATHGVASLAPRDSWIFQWQGCVGYGP